MLSVFDVYPVACSDIFFAAKVSIVMASVMELNHTLDSGIV